MISYSPASGRTAMGLMSPSMASSRASSSMPSSLIVLRAALSGVLIRSSGSSVSCCTADGLVGEALDGDRVVGDGEDDDAVAACEPEVAFHFGWQPDVGAALVRRPSLDACHVGHCLLIQSARSRGARGGRSVERAPAN